MEHDSKFGGGVEVTALTMVVGLWFADDIWLAHKTELDLEG